MGATRAKLPAPSLPTPAPQLPDASLHAQAAIGEAAVNAAAGAAAGAAIGLPGGVLGLRPWPWPRLGPPTPLDLGSPRAREGFDLEEPWVGSVLPSSPPSPVAGACDEMGRRGGGGGAGTRTK